MCANKPTEPENWRIDEVVNGRGRARRDFLALIGCCAYCFLTAIHTTDRDIVLNAEVELPVAGVDVPMTGFFPAAALLGKPTEGTLAACVVCGVFFGLGLVFWHAMLGRYTSAGG